MYDTPAGVGGKIDTATGLILSGPLSGTTANKDEPAALSSVAGAAAYSSKVQPVIDQANQTTEAARTAAAARVAAAFGTPPAEQLPPDVLAELEAGKTEEQKLSDQQISAWDTQAKDAKSVYDSLTLASHASVAAQINSLTGSWQERRQLLQESNKANTANWTQQFLRTGQAEYSPGMTSSFITGKEQEGLRKVKTLDDEYNGAVAAVNAAAQEKDFTRAASLSASLSSIQDKMLEAMKENAKEAAATNKKINDNLLQNKLEMTVAGAVKQGMTDPAEIQAYLKDTGASLTSLADIDKILKIVNPSADLTGLSADYKTFKFLQDNQDPAVDGLDYYGFLRATSNAQRKPDSGTTDTFKLSSTQQSQLLTGGFTFDDIKAMQNDIGTYGIDQTVAGLPKDKADLVRRSLAGSDTVASITNPEGTVFTREYVAGLYGIPDTNTTMGSFLGIGGTTGTSKLDDLMSRINAWHAAGYTDKDIQKELES